MGFAINIITSVLLLQSTLSLALDWHKNGVRGAQTLQIPSALDLH